MFRGVNRIHLDAKWRLVVPARFRTRLAPDQAPLILTIDTHEPCLLLYPLDVWESIESTLNALPTFDPTVRRVQRLLIGYASDLELDGQGRILIPQALREYAGLDKQVVLLGQGRKFEIWNEHTWQQRSSEYLQKVQLGTLCEPLKLLAL